MTTVFCLVILAGVVGAAVVAGVWARRVAAGGRGVVADVWARRRQPRFQRLAGEGDPIPDLGVFRPVAPRVVPNVKPPSSVHEFMGREPDTSLWGWAIWVTDDGELAWCPYVRPAAPLDGS